jgi:hypothetical protein
MPTNYSHNFSKLYLDSILQGPPLDSYGAACLAFFAFLVVVNLVLTNRSKQWADRLLALAAVELRNRVRGWFAVGIAPPEPLVSRSAREVQRRLRCPVITDPMLQEVLRSLSLEESAGIEVSWSSHRLEVLENVIKAYQPQRPQLLSIADTNRTYAYALSVIGATLALFWFQFETLSLLGYTHFLPWVIGALQIGLGISCLRAMIYWREAYRKASGESANVESRKPHLVMDFFVYVAESDHPGLVHVNWGPFWETLTFSLCPSTMYRLALWFVAQVFRWLHREQAFARWTAHWAGPGLILVILLVGVLYFSRLHQYRYFEVRGLQKRLEWLRRELQLDEMSLKPAPAEIAEEYVAVCKKLWTITGWTPYGKSMGHAGRRLMPVK